MPAIDPGIGLGLGLTLAVALGVWLPACRRKPTPAAPAKPVLGTIVLRDVTPGGHTPPSFDGAFLEHALRLFDDLYTAPRSGFRDSTDYYHRSSSHSLISRITLPTLILTARDDPFIAVEPFEELTPPPNVTLRILPKGGHVGFLGLDGDGGIRWAERRLVNWLLED